MSDWVPVKRTTSDVQGIDRKQVRVVLRIDREPEQEWRRFFTEAMAEVANGFSFGGTAISAGVPDDELDAFVTSGSASIASANRRYEEEALPKVHAQQEAGRIKADEDSRRLQAARNILNQHDG